MKVFLIPSSLSLLLLCPLLLLTQQTKPVFAAPIVDRGNKKDANNKGGKNNGKGSDNNSFKDDPPVVSFEMVRVIIFGRMNDKT